MVPVMIFENKTFKLVVQLALKSWEGYSTHNLKQFPQERFTHFNSFNEQYFKLHIILIIKQYFYYFILLK